MCLQVSSLRQRWSMQLLVSAVSSMQLARMRSAVAAMRHAIVVDSQQIDKQRKLAALGQESNYRIAELAAEMSDSMQMEAVTRFYLLLHSWSLLSISRVLRQWRESLIQVPIPCSLM